MSICSETVQAEENQQEVQDLPPDLHTAGAQCFLDLLRKVLRLQRVGGELARGMRAASQAAAIQGLGMAWAEHMRSSRAQQRIRFMTTRC